MVATITLIRGADKTTSGSGLILKDGYEKFEKIAPNFQKVIHRYPCYPQQRRAVNGLNAVT